MESTTEVASSQASEKAPTTAKGSAFWLSFIAILVATLLSALDLTAVSTALPTITADLDGADNFVWVGSAYALSATAILPLSGGLANIFGRKPIVLICIAFFALGSALGGAAQNMNMLIAARSKPLPYQFLLPRYTHEHSLAVQGIGGGGILNLTETIISDLIPLAERGLFQGIVALTWAFASGIGPPIVSSVSAARKTLILMTQRRAERSHRKRHGDGCFVCIIIIVFISVAQISHPVSYRHQSTFIRCGIWSRNFIPTSSSPGGINHSKAKTRRLVVSISASRPLARALTALSQRQLHCCGGNYSCSYWLDVCGHPIPMEFSASTRAACHWAGSCRGIHSV